MGIAPAYALVEPDNFLTSITLLETPRDSKIYTSYVDHH